MINEPVTQPVQTGSLKTLLRASQVVLLNCRFEPIILGNPLLQRQSRMNNEYISSLFLVFGGKFTYEQAQLPVCAKSVINWSGR